MNRPLDASPHAGVAKADLPAWVSRWQDVELPILASTAEAIEELSANEEAVDAHLLAGRFSGDPLMVLTLLRHVARHRSERTVTDVETATAALVLLGIGPFFRLFRNLPTVEARLADLPAALNGLQAVIDRAQRASRFALAFAVHRLDHDATVLQEAAMLHDFAEMLLWAHHPETALELASRTRSAALVDPAPAERQLLGLSLSELQQALMRNWHLPDLLVRTTSDGVSSDSQVRTVQSAVRLARHSSTSWDAPGVAADVDEIAALLNKGRVPTIELLHEFDG